MRITIVGGGPGGLVAALAARRRGMDVEILEQASAVRAVGSGIVLWTNALRMLATLGLDGAVRDAGAVIHEGRMERADGTLLKRIDFRPVQERYGQPSVAIHRGVLSTLLEAALPADAVRLSARVEATGDGQLVCGGEVVEGDVVVGADGIHSEVRRAVVGTVAPRYAGYTAWRGISAVSPLPPGVSVERWGRGRRFGIVPIGAGRTYWFGTEGGPPRGADPDDDQDQLLARFAEFGPDVADLVRATARVDILRNDIVDLPPLVRWHRDRFVLLGDAAHAMTPNLGQGACQAVEDAVCLAAALERHPADRDAAFFAYTRERTDRARLLQRLSDRFGNVGQWSNPVLATIRDAAFRLVPSALVQRNLEALYAVEVPLH